MAALGAIGVARPAVFSRTLNVWAATNALPSGYVARQAAVSRTLDVWAATNALPSGYVARPMDFMERMAWWGAPPYISAPRTGTLSGISSKPNARVMLYSRQSGQPIAFIFAAADGSYAFTALDQSDTAGYFAVALDPLAVDNALVADLLTPV